MDDTNKYFIVRQRIMATLIEAMKEIIKHESIFFFPCGREGGGGLYLQS